MLHRLIGVQASIGIVDQVVQHDERARRDQRHRATEDGAEAHRHDEARHRQPGARGNTGHDRQEQCSRADILHK